MKNENHLRILLELESNQQRMPEVEEEALTQEASKVGRDKNFLRGRSAGVITEVSDLLDTTDEDLLKTGHEGLKVRQFLI